MSKSNIIIALVVATVVIVGGYFWYTPISHEKDCLALEHVFRQNYSELYATSTLSNDPADIAIASHYSAKIGKCFIKIQRHDNMKYSYTSTDKTILYDVVADKSVANCTTILQRETAVGTQCSQGDKTITQEEFNALEQEYMQR